jgi:hypothetical protein
VAAGGAQLLLMRVDLDRAPVLGAGAALPQRAALAPSGEAGLPRRGDLGLVAGRAARGAGVLVDAEVVDGKPTRTALGNGNGLIVWVWPAARRAARVCPDP